MVKRLVQLLVNGGEFFVISKDKQEKIKLKPVGYPFALPEPIFWSTVDEKVLENAPDYANAYTISQSSASSGQRVYAVQYYKIV